MPSTPRKGLADLAALIEVPQDLPDPFAAFNVTSAKGHTHLICSTCGEQADSRRTDLLAYAAAHDCEED